MTPLYKALKENGTTIYAFPGVEEDINMVGDNYKIHFSKFALLDLPKQQISLDDEPKHWDFESAFFSSSNLNGEDYKTRIINSLRNYVANHETTMKSTRVSDSEFYYDNSILKTNSERIFWKWARKLNLIDFEIAREDTEYFSDLDEFQPNNLSDNEFIREYLWKERETSENYIKRFYESSTNANKLEVEYNGTINYRVGDFIEFFEVQNGEFPNISKYAKVLNIVEPNGSDGYIVTFDIEYIGSNQIENNGYSILVYNSLVKYIGEIQGNNSVVSNNLSFDQVMAFIADNAGKTPDVLFRTTHDDNYKPNLQFPILASQYQAEILGAENFNSPIVSNPTNYPGDQYALFDNDNNLNEYNYLTSSGDILRRTGDYFGVFGDRDNLTFDSSKIDGISLDLNKDHYAKMNIINQELDNFDEFNTQVLNNKFPSDFKFNAILWYYTAEDKISGETSTNLYGISFLNNPDNNELNKGIEFPNVTKYVATNSQDGTGHQFALNRHTVVTNDNNIPQFSNEYINQLFGFDLYNEAMRRLITYNNNTNSLLSDNNQIKNQVNELTQLIFTDTDKETINSKLEELTSLIQMYNTNQIVDTESIKVEKDNSSSPAQIKLYNKEGNYFKVDNILTKNLYDETDGSLIPKAITIPDGKDFMVNVTNNDDNTNVNLEENLKVILNKDLFYRQKVDFVIDANEVSSDNKKLDISILYRADSNSSIVENVLVSNIDLPVYFNIDNQSMNSSYKWKDVNLDVEQIDLNNDNETIGIHVNRISSYIKQGDVIVLKQVIIDSNNTYLDISGQYLIDTIDYTNKIVNIDFTQNENLESYIESELSNSNINLGDELLYDSIGYMTLSDKKMFSIIRVDESDDSSIESRYKII